MNIKWTTALLAKITDNLLLSNAAYWLFQIMIMKPLLFVTFKKIMKVPVPLSNHIFVFISFYLNIKHHQSNQRGTWTARGPIAEEKYHNYRKLLWCCSDRRVTLIGNQWRSVRGWCGRGGRGVGVWGRNDLKVHWHAIFLSSTHVIWHRHFNRAAWVALDRA